MRPGNCRLISKMMKYPKNFKDLEWDNVIENPELLANKAIELKDFQSNQRITLPIQDEPFQRALGVRLEYNWRLGITVNENGWSEEKARLQLRNLNLQESVLIHFRKTIELLKAQNETVLVEVSGVFTTMNAFLPYEKLIVMTRRSPNEFEQITGRIIEILRNYLVWLDRWGVDYIYFTDAVAGVDIVGPKFARKYLGPLLLRILPVAEDFQQAKVLLCPRVFLTLEIMDSIRPSKVGPFYASSCSAFKLEVPIGEGYRLVSL